MLLREIAPGITLEELRAIPGASPKERFR